MDEDLMPIEKVLAERMRGCVAGECLEADALLELAEKGKRAQNYAALMSHVAVCGTCRDSLKLLKEVELSRPRRAFAFPIWMPRIGYGLAAAAAAAAVFVMMNRETGVVDDSGPPIVKTNPAPKPPTVTETTPPNPPSTAVENAPEEVIVKNVPRRRRARRPMEQRPEPPTPKQPIRYEELWTADSGVIEGEVMSAEVISGEVIPPDSLSGEVLSDGSIDGTVSPPRSDPPR